MRRFIKLVLLAGLAFYLGWPTYSGYQIHRALEDEDPLALANKVDFDRVRESLRPAVESQIDKQIASASNAAGAAGANIAAKLQPEAKAKMIDATLEAMVTPESILRLYSSKEAIKDTLAKLALENAGSGALAGLDLGQLKSGAGGATGTLGKLTEKGKSLGIDTSKIGGVFGGNATEATAAVPAAAEGTSAEKPQYGFANIKGFGLNGPLGLQLGFAKDPAATDADMTVEMSFTGSDWKLTGLRPRI